jgi:hypothetical protein
MKRTTGMLATSRQIPWSFPSVPPPLLPVPVLSQSTRPATRHHTGISVHHQEKSSGSVSGRALVGELGKSRSFVRSIFKFWNRDPAAPRARRSKRPEVDRDARRRIPFVRILTYVHTYQCVHTYLPVPHVYHVYVCMHQHRSEHAQRSDILLSAPVRLFLFNCICQTFDPLDSPLSRPGFYGSYTHVAVASPPSSSIPCSHQLSIY